MKNQRGEQYSPRFFAAKNFILRSGDFVCLIRAELLVMECF